MLSNFPKLSPELSIFDKVINVLAWIALAGFLIGALVIVAPVIYFYWKLINT